MITPTHNVIVWVSSTHGKSKYFTITARNASGNQARLQEVEAQVAEAGFVEDYRETDLSKTEADARKKIVKQKYIQLGYIYHKRNALPKPM